MAVSAQCWNGTHKRGLSLHDRESAKGTETQGEREIRRGEETELLLFVAHSVKHHEITDAARRFAMLMRKSLATVAAAQGI